MEEESFHADGQIWRIFFYYQLMHKRNALKRIIKVYIKTAPTCFGVIIIIIIRERTVWAC